MAPQRGGGFQHSLGHPAFVFGEDGGDAGEEIGDESDEVGEEGVVFDVEGIDGEAGFEGG